MKRMTVAAWMAMGLLTLPFAVQAEQASPAVLADASAACHGTDGKSPSTIPSIQGKSIDYMVQRLMAFKGRYKIKLSQPT
ncbi:hypothetical protein C2W62_31880 [Candidatus Entotheonella serta]|nr:hypothetical protein C2W62_31880 [Candidatus Entotheonella serta]